ncbi:hypothetical protein IAQ61_003266 [Plenodomus lingam]|uniref:uncharacterized protein n=1 Tax=Leptosphaeria maculans TaxID=5022 RepID=UPI003320B325|nr:hypothetical protein IAQ61_003266 [Plenodomus lingam]
MFDKDVATGLAGREGYSSKGPSSSFGFKNVMPDSEVDQCYTWDPVLTCTTEQLEAVANGTAVVKDYVVSVGEINNHSAKPVMQF